MSTLAAASPCFVDPGEQLALADEEPL